MPQATTKRKKEKKKRDLVKKPKEEIAKIYVTIQ